MQQGNVSSTLLIRPSKGKVMGVTGTITGCGQQANESVLGRRGNRWLWNYGGLWIVGGNWKADILPKPDTCKASIFNCLQLFIIRRKISWPGGSQYREVNPEACSRVLGKRITQCRSFDWKFIRQVRAPAKKKQMSRCPPKETRLVIFRFPDVAARYSQQPQEDMGFQETFPDKVCWGMEMAPKLP